jgi:plastocyanin
MIMNKRNIISSLVLTGLFALSATSANAQDACTGPAETHTLMVNQTNNVPTGVTLGNEPADDLYVCPGDTVAWILQGLGFTINFPGATPFNANSHRPVDAGRVTAVVRSDVAPGESFKYDISIDGGGVLDPRIIIQE